MNMKGRDFLVKLPEEMDLEILSYLEEVDQESFIYMNKFLYDRLYVGKMRELNLWKWQNILHFLVYDDFRSQVLRRVKQPHKQLSIALAGIYRGYVTKGLAETTLFLASKQSVTFVPSLTFPQPSLSLRSNELSSPSISSLQVKSLSISDVLFYRYFLTTVKRLTSLELYRDTDQPSFLPRVLSYLQTHSTSLGLKELRLSGYRKLQQLLFVAGIEKVTLEFMEEFTSFDEEYFVNTNNPTTLKTIILYYCFAFCDLSKLHTVPNVMLKNCPKVQHIDALQKNESVMIDRCDMVVDYWRSFREVKDLTISCARSLPSFDRIEYTMITSLTLTDIWFPVQYPRTFPSTLKKFVARHVWYFHPNMIESHSLNHVIIDSCHDYTQDIVGCSHVKRIELINLLIRNIHLFGAVHHSVVIEKCGYIRDFSYLSNIDTLCLRKCKNVDIQRLSSIRNLSIIDCWIESKTGALNNIHTLSLYPMDLDSLITDKSFYHGLKKVVNLETPFHPLLFKYWSLERFSCQKLIVTKVEEKEWKEILVFWSREINRNQKYYMMEYLKRLKLVKFTLKKSMK